MKTENTYRFASREIGEAFIESVVRGKPDYNLAIKPFLTNGPETVKMNPAWLTAKWEFAIIAPIR